MEALAASMNAASIPTYWGGQRSPFLEVKDQGHATWASKPRLLKIRTSRGDTGLTGDHVTAGLPR